MKKEDFIKLLQKKEKDGKVLVQTLNGIQAIDLEQLCNQPTEGLLYDLNRDKATCLTFIPETTWINNYACASVIEYLKNRIEELENKLEKYESKD